MKRWQLAPRCHPGRAARLSRSLGISSLLATLLIQRGYADVEAARRFLTPQLEDLHSPFAFRSMHAALARLQLARERRERIGVFGDYDVDGITSTALLVSALRDQGLEVSYRLPERLAEGYGLSRTGLEELVAQGVTLLLTVDCGIASREEIAWAQSQGVDTIVCDHHLPPPFLPPAVALLDPKLPAEGYPFTELAGVGVALKLAQALSGRLDPAWLELAALGTVADVAPLTGENRVLVAQGLRAMAASSFPGLKALLAQAGLDPERLSAGQLSFRLAPRLNALGRLGDASPGVELLLTRDEDRAQELASLLEQENRTRQEIEAEVLAEAVAQIEATADLEEDMALVAAGEAWHPGVLGIVASRLVERWHRPALVISLSGEEAKGSGRSIPAFSLYEGLKKSSRWLKQFGGHHLAAGFSLRRADLAAFRSAFLAVARSSLSREDLVACQAVDAEVKLADLDLTAVAELERMAPFGRGNPEPLLLLKDVDAEHARPVGRTQEHLRLRLSQGGRQAWAVAFGLGERAGELAGGRLDVIGTPAVNEWQGRQSVEVVVKDVYTPADPAAICCIPPLPGAPLLYDFRNKGSAGPCAARPGPADLYLTAPPLGPADLEAKLVPLPPGARVWLLFGARELTAGQQAVRRRYPDRDFLVGLYLALRAVAPGTATAGVLSRSLGAPGAAVRQGLAVLEELGLVQRQPAVGGEPLFQLQERAGGRRVDLTRSRTFRALARERRRALAFLDFIGCAPGPRVAAFCALVWLRAHKMTERQLMC